MTVFPESRGLSSLCPPGGSNSNSQMARALVQVNVLPLRQILEPYATAAIHFLKIDAEGSERDVLLGMDFHRFRPWVVLVEATEPLTSVAASQHWMEILTANRYLHVYFDGLNEFFVAAEHEDLTSRFQTPPNVFDEFELASTVRERQWRQEMETVLRADISALQKDCTVLRARNSPHRRRSVRVAHTTRFVAGGSGQTSRQCERAVGGIEEEPGDDRYHFPKQIMALACSHS